RRLYISPVVPASPVFVTMLMRPKSEMRNVKRKARIAMLLSAFAAGEGTGRKTLELPLDPPGVGRYGGAEIPGTSTFHAGSVGTPRKRLASSSKRSTSSVTNG